MPGKPVALKPINVENHMCMCINKYVLTHKSNKSFFSFFQANSKCKLQSMYLVSVLEHRLEA